MNVVKPKDTITGSTQCNRCYTSLTDYQAKAGKWSEALSTVVVALFGWSSTYLALLCNAAFVSAISGLQMEITHHGVKTLEKSSKTNLAYPMISVP